MFTKLLIANRGEIACRIMRTARRLGYRTVAVYSDADADALHVQQADEAVHLGAAPAAASYLDVEAIVAAARRSSADAVHPGYGFLSERADFADACAAAGLVFVGPPAAAIRAMGDKAAAKRRMIAAGVPCAPGWLGDHDADGDAVGVGEDDGEGGGDARLAAAAAALGYPLLVKAVAGGGGRGMRLVRAAAELGDAIAGARREARGAFGDGRLMLERLIEGGRHVEVQVCCDAHGGAVHLGERDCTAQRRRQKVIEEAPSPIVDAALREALGRDAVAAARAAGYLGAGTVEFIVDAEGRHWFLEMNTRLQVEHAVTECLTGIDLVEWQLRIAQGEALPLAQHEIRFTGHAVEARLYAEDPYDGFAPRSGRITGWRPERAAGVRIDHGIAVGTEVTPYYDAMLAKFIAHGATRADAIRRLVRALDDAPLFGPATNARFLRDVLRHPRFAAGTMTTTLIDEWAAGGDPLLQRPPPPDEAWQLAAALLGGTAAARPASLAQFEITLHCQGQARCVAAPPPGLTIVSHVADELRYATGGVTRKVPAVRDGAALQIAVDAAVHTFTEPSPLPRAGSTADARQARAPVAGVVAHVAVAPGDAVDAGTPLVCVEAMKMEMWLHAAARGTVRRVHVAPQDAVAAGALLVELEVAA